jgi:hypothetical protein
MSMRCRDSVAVAAGMPAVADMLAVVDTQAAGITRRRV